ncbi:MAG: asparagine synthase (glutamine-hydrolyzing) [Spartobacteria bacterium]
MCGILGTFNCRGNALALQIAAISHRGPDGAGEWRSSQGHCWMGHSRLSIIELSDAGTQPMTSASGRTILVFNGEIYNHLELRSKVSGISWRGHSDSETLLELWERYGEECLAHLRGMFAFAVYDTLSDSLHIVRDRLGIKPLFFCRDKESLSFASEARALLKGQRPCVDGAALASYLASGHLPSSGKIGDEIEIFPPATLLRISRDGNLSWKKWWNFPCKGSSASKPVSYADARTKIRLLVDEAVKEHLLSDVPVGAFLSGGIDSSIICLSAANHLGSALHTFCVGFPDAGFDERRIAKLVAEKAGASHTEIEVGPKECQQWVVEAVNALDLPSVDAINTYIVSRAVQQSGIKVALSGLGGDELFCGYPSCSDVPRLALLRALPKYAAKKLISILPANVREKLEGTNEFDPFTLALLRRRWWSDQALREAGLNNAAEWPAAPSPFLDDIQAISCAEIFGYMEPMLLRDSDQMSMAVSLEIRVPFLDCRLVEYTLNLPGAWKRGRPPKRLLIDAFADLLPSECWNRPKQGFSLPMDTWMRGPLHDFCRQGLSAAAKSLNPAFVERAYHQFKAGKIHWTRVWQIVVLGHYLDCKK